MQNTKISKIANMNKYTFNKFLIKYLNADFSLKIMVFFLFLIFVIILFSQNSKAKDETIANEWIVEKYDVFYKNMTTVYTNGTIEIYEAVIFGDNKSADELRELYKNESLRELMLENLTNKAESTYKDMIKDIFPNATSNFNRTRIYINETTLFNDTNSDEFYIPINIIADADVFLTGKSYKMEKVKKLEDVILGVLKMGGIITKEINLSADEGHKRVFNFYLPEEIKFVNGTQTMEKVIDNLNGTTYKKSKFNFSIESTNPNPSLKENIFVRLSIDMLDFGEIYINIVVSIDSVGIMDYDFPKSISNLDFISDDGIRLGVSTNLTSWNEIYNKSIKELKDEVEGNLSKTFGNVSLNFSWDNSTLVGYNLTTMKGRDIICYLNGTIITDKIYNKDKKLVVGLVNSGAKIRINITLKEKYNYDNELILPENYKLITNENVVSGERDIVYFGKSLQGKLAYKNAIEYTSEKKNLKIIVDMHTVDLIFVGVKLKADVIGEVDVYWTVIPEYFEKKLPKEVEMEYANADAMRIALAYKLISIEDIKNETEGLKKKIESNVSKSLDKNIKINIKINPESLLNYDIEKMNAEKPMKIEIKAEVEYSLNVLSKKALIEFAFSFPFETIENSTTTYKVKFPRGIAIISAEDDLKKVKKGSEDNRDFIELTLGKGEKDKVDLKIDIRLWFILEKLFPCLMIIALIILFFVYRKIRKWKKKKNKVLC